MPEEQENQIERRDPGGMNRRSETARRGTDAARFVGDLTKRKTPVKRPTVRDPDLSVPDLESEFEVEVERALLLRGYRIDRQVWVSHYLVDLAIISKDNRKYDLGIDCNGMPYYQPSPSSVARDAQRTKALKDQGWNIHQIESKEWVSNPEFELEKLVAVLNKIRLDS